jgi:tetratricopeptide (TPR) repeat protein
VRLGRLDEAYRSFEKTGEVAPTFDGVPSSLGMIRFRQRRYKSAVEFLSTAIEMRKEFGQDFGEECPEGYLGRGRALLLLGKYDEARSDLIHALQFPGTQTNATLALARLLATGPEPFRDPSKAIAITRQTEPSTKFDATRGAAYYRLGRYAEAKGLLIDALQKDEDDDFGYSAEKLYFLAMTCCRLEEPDEAAQSFARAEAWMATSASPEDVHLRAIQREAADLMTSQTTNSDCRTQGGRRAPTAKQDSSPAKGVPNDAHSARRSTPTHCTTCLLSLNRESACLNRHHESTTDYRTCYLVCFDSLRRGKAI